MDPTSAHKIAGKLAREPNKHTSKRSGHLPGIPSARSLLLRRTDRSPRSLALASFTPRLTVVCGAQAESVCLEVIGRQTWARLPETGILSEVVINE
eukprot:2248994-Rhodomonas_salina.1